MKMHAASRILIAAGLCVAALLGIVVREALARAGGQEVILPMEAIDPRSLLSGHYVIVDLRERLAPGEPCPAEAQNTHWIALTPVGDAHSVAGVAASRDQALEIASIPVEGTLTCNPPSPDGAQPGAIWINLGIDRFYINQADAQRIEAVMRQQRPGEAARVFAIISVGRDGKARLKGLRVDGQRLELTWL